jgi:hypothetical protein
MRIGKKLKGLFNGFRATAATAPAPSPTTPAVRPCALPARLYYAKAYPLSPWCHSGWWEDEQGTKVSPFFATFEQAAAWRLTMFTHGAGK